MIKKLTILLLLFTLISNISVNAEMLYDVANIFENTDFMDETDGDLEDTALQSQAESNGETDGMEASNISENTGLTEEMDSVLVETAPHNQTENNGETGEDEILPDEQFSDEVISNDSFFWGGWFPQEPSEDGEYIEQPGNMAERHFSFTIRRGTSFESVAAPEINIIADNIREPYDVCNVWLEVVWNLSEVDIEQLGTHQITGEIINTYDNITLVGTEITADVEIVLQYKPAFRYASYNTHDGVLYLYFSQWFPNKNQTLKLWFTDDDGDTWTDISRTGRVRYDEGFSGIFVSDIEVASVYGFYIEVEGDGDLGGWSDIYITKIDEDGIVENLDKFEGGRNGTSRPPASTQEEDTIDKQNSGNKSSGNSSGQGKTTSSNSNTQTNTETSGNTELSARQIQLEAKFNPKYLPFSAEGLTAEISTPFLVKRSEWAAVELNKISDTKFSVGIQLGGKKMESLPQSYTCYFPYAPSKASDDIVIADGNGNIIPASFYDAMNKRMVLTTVKTGAFTVKTNAPSTFPDTKNHWSNEAVSFLSSRSIVSGFSNGSFKPNDKVSSGEWLTMLARLNGTTAQSAKKGQKWYEPYTNWAVSKGIANGRTNFEATLSREQACKYLYDYAKVLGLQTIDVTVSKEALSNANNNTAVAVFYQLGIIQGMSDGKFHPNEILTRGQCAEIIKNFIKICYR